MKFSDIEQDQWDELRPYLDTCLLPVTGLTGLEEPWQATGALERLRDLMDPVEIPYKGRVVTYPAVHYVESGERFTAALEALVESIRKGGFKYVFVIAADERVLPLLPAGADLIITEQLVSEGRLKRSVEQTWTAEK